MLILPFCSFASEANIHPLNNYFVATNRSFKIEVNGQTVFFRIGREHPEELGIDRISELAFYEVGEKVGIAPKILGFETDHGLLITEYIDGASPTKEELSSTIEKVIDHLHLLHSYPFTQDKMPLSTVFLRNDALLKTLETLGLKAEISDKVDRWLLTRESFEKDHYQNIPVGVCHGDLFRGNMLLDAHQNLFIIDWEYAFYGYVIDDLGKFCSSNWLSDEEIARVSALYWGTSDERMLQKLYQNIFMQQFNFFLWCQIQAFYHTEENASFDELVGQVEAHLDRMRKNLECVCDLGLAF